VSSECIVEPNLQVSNINTLSVAQNFFQGEFMSHVKINGNFQSISRYFVRL